MREGKPFQSEAVSVLYQEQRQENVRESGGFAPLIPKLGISLRRVVTFTPRFTPGGNVNRGLISRRASPDGYREKKKKPLIGAGNQSTVFRSTP